MVGCFKEMIFTYIDSSDISLSNGANRSSLSRFIQKLLKKHQGLLYFETDISREKQELKQIIYEWNSRTCVTDLFNSWTKRKPKTEDSNLSFLLYNVSSLRSHITDMDIIISNHAPKICFLTEIGETALKILPQFPDYRLLVQEGTNSFGGVGLLIHNSIKYKEAVRDLNFLMVEIETTPIASLVGVVYVPPGTIPPFDLFTKCRNKSFYIFGDFNAKHGD